MASVARRLATVRAAATPTVLSARRSPRPATGLSGCLRKWWRCSRTSPTTVGEEDPRRLTLAGESGWVCATLLGRPIAPNSDYHEWRAILESAGVRHTRLHDGCHTAVTVLLFLGVPEWTVMSSMGGQAPAWPRDEYVTDPIRR